ncbi:MAG: DUF4249 domain-containing protein [Bacteroidota bacterium]
MTSNKQFFYVFKLFIFASIIASLVTACNNLEQTITPDLNQASPRYVIEGLVTNAATTQQVTVSRSTGYYNSGATEKISNASVVIEDDAGNIFTFEESEDTPGRYTANFTGEIGRTYSLLVNIEGELFEASESMLPITTIDSLTWEIDEEERQELEEDNDDSGEYYDVFLFTREPPETEDYYLFKFYTNGVIENDDAQEVYFSDDAVIGESIDGLEIGFFYALEDSVTVEMYSITRNAFLFFSDLQTLLNNDGGVFGPIPANLRNNISNGALGYFQVSAIDRESIVIGK